MGSDRAHLWTSNRGGVGAVTKLRMRYAGRPASVRVPRELRAVGSDPGEQGAACGTSAAAELRAGGRDAARVGLGTVPADDLERGAVEGAAGRRHPYPVAGDAPGAGSEEGRYQAYLRAGGWASEQERREHFEKLVADWPPLTEAQRVRLGLLLRVVD